LVQNVYQSLGPNFSAEASAVRFPNASIIALNTDLLTHLGLTLTAHPEQIFSGQILLPGSRPIAQAYAGHQFGNFVPQLGDGRAMLLGEIGCPDGALRDIHLKGAGPTQFSRRGDGRAALGPVLREYLVSEALHALGLPTTRALAAVASGDRIHRETPLPGAILTRIAKSHIRIGTFEYFAARGDTTSLAALANHVIDRHHPECAQHQGAERYLALLEAVCHHQALLISEWMRIGFIHGVMNTDNMTVSGETLDFGPCAFLDEYHPRKTFSYIDSSGRYAFANQPSIALWNLTRFAECLLPLCNENPAEAVPAATHSLEIFGKTYQSASQNHHRSKLGLLTQQPEDDSLFTRLLELMQKNGADFTRTFHALTQDACGSPDHKTGRGESAFLGELCDTSESRQWQQDWKNRLQSESSDPSERHSTMRRANPFIIPRNHLIERVIRSAEDLGDFTPFHQLHAALQTPFSEDEVTIPFSAAPTPDQRIRNTFCGT
jgi:uncharacterized protein YdiU (UPF0061 family)